MVKRSKKVLSMALALTMVTGAFSSTGAFAAGYEAVAAIEADVTTNFYTLDENGVRSKLNNAGEAIATCSYKNKNGDVINTAAGGKFYVGERYTLNVTQTEEKAAKYKISTGEGKMAKMLVTLNGEEKYVTDLAIVQEDTTKNNYTVSFDAMTSSKIGAGGLNKGNVEIALDVERQSDYTVKGCEYAPAVQTVATFNPVEGLNDPAKDDVYFKFEKAGNVSKDKEYVVDSTKLGVKFYTDKECKNAVEGADAPAVAEYELKKDFTKGVNYYKLSSKAADKSLNDVLSGKNIKGIELTIGDDAITEKTGKKTITFDDADLKNWKYNGKTVPKAGITAVEGAVVKLKYNPEKVAEGKCFDGAFAKIGDADAKKIEDQYIDYANNEVSFIVPAGDVTGFKANVFADAKTLTDDSNNTNVYLVNDKNQAVKKGEKIYLNPNQAQTVKFKVETRKEFFNYLNDAPDISAFTGAGGAAANWNFVFKGITEENGEKCLNYEVTVAGGADAVFNEAVFADYVGDENAENIYVPVKFDQLISEADNNANVAISYVGDGMNAANGQISTSKDSYIKVNCIDDVKLKDGCLVNEKGEGTHFDIQKDNKGYSFAIKGSADNKGKILSVEASYNNGTVNTEVNPDGAGYVNVYDKDFTPLTNSRVDPEEFVYFQVKANEGYILKEKDGVSVLAGDTVVNLSEATRYGEKYYSFKMPEKVNDDDAYGPSVTIKANFELANGVKITNETPETAKDKNNGYISGLLEAVKAGDEVAFQAKPNDNYIPDTVKAVAYKNGAVVESTIAVSSVEGANWAYKFTVPANLDADEIKVSATFKEYTPATEDGWDTTSAGEWIYVKDGKQVTGWQDKLPGWEGQWFYFDENGIMLEGWQDKLPGWEGQWFYFDKNTGVMLAGWQTNIPGWGNTWFYFDKNTGVMYKNGYTPDGYYVDGNGCWIA